MVEQIEPNIHRIEVPMPQNPLQYLNSYVVKGRPGDRNLIVDTGFNRPETIEVMTSALNALEIDLEQTDFFLTHFHADHTGLVSHLSTPHSIVYMSAEDLPKIQSPNPLEPELKAGRSHGFPEQALQTVRAFHPASNFLPKSSIRHENVSEGDTLQYADYEFRCIETPGHTPGHRCLYEENLKILVSGDHLLEDITPNISVFRPEEENLLDQYLESLKKIREMDVQRVFPGHRRMFEHSRRRVQELLTHHKERLKEIEDRVNGWEHTAYEVSSWISWDLEYEDWEHTHPLQRWFALGETVAHLKFLVKQGRVQEHTDNGTILYTSG